MCIVASETSVSAGNCRGSVALALRNAHHKKRTSGRALLANFRYRLAVCYGNLTVVRLDFL